MAEGRGPRQEVVIEALVLAFSRSRGRQLVGAEALRAVLSGQARDMTADGMIDLRPLWDLLASQPDFDPELIKPAICRFKSWERELGAPVELPDPLAELAPAELAALAARCPVPAAELDRALGRSADRDSAPRRARRTRTSSLADAGGARTGLAAAALVIGLGAMGFAGFTLYGECSARPAYEDVALTLGDIPTTRSLRRGDELGATLTDESWLGLPEPTRTSQLQSALEDLGADGVRVIFLRDPSGKVRATAQWFSPVSGQRQVQVRFLP